MTDKAFSYVLPIGLSVALFMTAACVTKTKTYNPRVPQVPPIGVAPLPLRAALVLPESLRSATYREELACFFSSAPVVVHTGPGLERAAVQAFSQVFDKLEPVRDKSGAEGYDAFVELSPPQLTLGAKCGPFSGDRPSIEAKAMLHAKVTDRKDQVLLDNTYSSGMHADERVSDAVGKALADVLQALTSGIVSANTVRAYAKVPSLSRPGEKISEAAPATTEERHAAARGIGFAVGFDYFLTAYHVIAGMPSLTIYHGDKSVPASLVLRDRLTDIALLKLEGTDHQPLPGLRLGDASKAREGDKVWTLDLNVEGQNKPVLHEGKIVAVSGAENDPRLFQFSLPGHQRHSGAPLLNQNGDVIGITVSGKEGVAMFALPEGSRDDLHLAIKIQYAKSLLNLLPESEYVTPAQTKRVSEPEAAKPQLVLIEARR